MFFEKRRFIKIRSYSLRIFCTKTHRHTDRHEKITLLADNKVMFSAGLYVCVSVRLRAKYPQKYERILMILSRKNACVLGTNQLP